MKLRDFLLGVATGLAAAYVIKEASEKIYPNKPANSVLSDIKNLFKQEGPIDGSWIFMEPEVFKKKTSKSLCIKAVFLAFIMVKHKVLNLLLMRKQARLLT